MPAMTRGTWCALLAIIVIARSAVFVFWPGSHFDSDQAVTGLMAKHLSELRAFPVFWYGQTYMLGVEAWLAAPVMAVAGPSVTALKLPLLAINVAVAWLLFLGLTGVHTGKMGGSRTALTPFGAAFATLFFVLPAPITAAHFLTANGGNVEPAFYILLLWFARGRPVLLGAILGIGFLNREFTIYGAAALLLMEAARRTLFTRARIVGWAGTFGTAAGVWILIQGLRRISSAAGPGTSIADISTLLAANNLVQVAERLCLDGAAIAAGAGRLLTVHWPELFGLESQPLTDFGIESAVRQGWSGAEWLLLPAVLIPAARILQLRRRDALDGANSQLTTSNSQLPTPNSQPPAHTFPAYLVLTATLSVAGYLVGRCGGIDFYTMRYELLSVLGAVGLGGWYLSRETSRPIRILWTACCGAVFATAAFAHGRLLAEYLTRPPIGAKHELILALESRGVRYAYADYWTAYYVTFRTRERVLVASTEVVKVRTHNNEVDAHRAEAILISRRPCEGGEPLTPAFWACRP